MNSQVIKIPTIISNRNYWFVRTDKGQLFDEFYFDQFIGIGWNEFSNVAQIREVDLDDFKDIFKTSYPKEERPGLACGQMKKFVMEMKVGDIVMIPSEQSERIAFGEITSEPYIADIQEADYGDEDARCSYNKRRRVSWNTVIKRDKLDPYLFRMMYAHNTITKANDYASFIDRTMDCLYIKDDIGHLVLHVNKAGKIPARILAQLIDRTISLIEDEEGTVDVDTIEVKVNVQSPGPIEFIAAAGTIFLLASIVHYVVGGKLELKINSNELFGKIESEGLVDKVLRFKEKSDARKADYNLLLAKLEAMPPKELLPKIEKDEDL